MLKVWLPLDGDLRNLGTDDITFIQNTGATIINEGKIGKCYSFDGNDDLLQWQFDKTKYDYKPISVTCWFKCDKTKTGAQMLDMAADLTLSYTYSSSGIKFGCWRCYANASGTRTGVSGFTSAVYDADVWHHVAVVFGAGKETIYVDGKFSREIDHTASYTNYWHPLLAASYNKITLAKSTGTPNTAGTNYWVGGLLNDVRIYDHCLSAAEVHEIAMGLVLHYKLDSAKIKTGTNLVTGVTKGGRTTVLTDGRIGVQTTGENADTYFTINLSESITNGTKYFLSCDASGISEGAYWGFPLGTQSNSTLPFKIYNGHNEYSFTANDISWGSNRLFMDDQGRADWANKATFWNFELYKAPTLEVEDSSGYGHNGTIIGDLISNSDTKRYSTSTRWNSSAPTESSETGICYIQTPFTLTTPLQLTVAWWAKPENGYGSSTNHAAFCTSNSTSRPTDYNTTALHHRDAGFDIYPSDGSGVKRLSFTYIKNEWHHYAITYDGTTAKSYKDGALQTNVSVGTNKTLATFSQLYIGYSQAGGVRRKTLGSYSDFRIYCTPLLDNDIKMLYNIGMKVDNLQNLHTFEYKENTSNLFRSELIMPWAKANRTRIGEIVSHNDTYALNIAPEPFYKNISDSISGALDGMFIQNTSYIFDMWIDTDSVISNNNNAQGGMVIRYSDNSTDSTFVFLGGNKGYQHKVLITPSNKTVQRLEFYYYTSTDVFYRIDSCICPLSNLKLYKTGFFEGTNLLEETNTKLIKNALIETNQLIEI